MAITAASSTHQDTLNTQHRCTNYGYTPPEITSQYSTRNAIMAVAQAISLPYVGSSTLTDSSTEHPGAAEENPTLSQKDAS